MKSRSIALAAASVLLVLSGCTFETADHAPATTASERAPQVPLAESSDRTPPERQLPPQALDIEATPNATSEWSDAPTRANRSPTRCLVEYDCTADGTDLIEQIPASVLLAQSGWRGSDGQLAGEDWILGAAKTRIPDDTGSEVTAILVLQALSVPDQMSGTDLHYRGILDAGAFVIRNIWVEGPSTANFIQPTRFHRLIHIDGQAVWLFEVEPPEANVAWRTYSWEEHQNGGRLYVEIGFHPARFAETESHSIVERLIRDYTRKS